MDHTPRFAPSPDAEPRLGADGLYRFAEPPAPAGRRHALLLADRPMERVRIGIVGLGVRGAVAAVRLASIEGAEVRALCDRRREAVEAAAARLAAAGHPRPACYDGDEGWMALCRCGELDLIYICTTWEQHAPMALYAMEQGHHVAVEVPAATSLEACWALVDTAERTRRHCMMLENCVYDHFELTTLNMARAGLFGELLHVGGAYIHHLDSWEQWRLAFNSTRRGDLYATHGLGPACQLLGIHRGDRMAYLTAMDTPAVNGIQRAREVLGTEEFANGDQTTTLIRTWRGRVIELQHNVCTPRPYSRMYQAVGSDGFAEKYPVEHYTFRPERLAAYLDDTGGLSHHAPLPPAAHEALTRRFRPRITEHIGQTARRLDPLRGGINYIMDYRLIHCLRRGLPLDQDVYDAAEWSCIGPLTGASLARHSAPVAVPDFTRGDWQRLDGYRHAGGAEKE